jgi:uncharacterized protein (TIGR03085 family)
VSATTPVAQPRTGGAHRAAPADRAYDHAMTQYARNERRALADLLIGVGPDAPTLCEGWTTRDLAAHLVVRERRPDTAAGILIPAFAGHTEKVRLAEAAKQYAEVVQDIRNPPWWSPVSNPLTHELANGLEFFVHHEDVRRARPDVQPRTLPTEQQRALWGAVRLTAKMGLRKLHAPVAVKAPGLGTVQVGTGTPQATLVGEPGELALFLSGRQRVARVQIEGEPGLVARLKGAKLGL